jgi:serine/threonine protein kinase
MPNGDLDKWLHRNFATQDETPKTRRRLTMSQRVSIALDVAEALDYLHNHGQVPIAHCDLKPSNVLLDNDMVAHVADFGLARFIRKAVRNSTEESSTSIGIKGTIGYIPPGASRSSALYIGSFPVMFLTKLKVLKYTI